MLIYVFCAIVFFLENEQLLKKVAKLTEALKQARGRSVPVAEGCVELVFGCVGFLFWIFS